MNHHWLVAGVGRSGTTAIYEALQNLSRRSLRKASYFYEPYLWGPPTWGPKFRRVTGAFNTTTSIHADGLRCHLATPLFASDIPERTPCHAEFVRGLFKDGRPSLAKLIRGCGRLRDYLELCPDVKIVFVMRNPLDCVNSILGNFSFFGDEFHPSDLPRFRRELEALGRPQPAFGAECAAATAWWHEMNQAAFRSFEGYRERVFVAPHEAFSCDRPATLRLLASFLCLTPKEKASTPLDKPVGPITREINLRADDFVHIAPFQANYADLVARVSDIPIEKKARAMLKKVRTKKYRSLRPGSFVSDVPRDASPVRVRGLLRREFQAKQSAIAGIRRASADLQRVESDLAPTGPVRS